MGKKPLAARLGTRNNPLTLTGRDSVGLALDHEQNMQNECTSWEQNRFQLQILNSLPLVYKLTNTIPSTKMQGFQSIVNKTKERKDSISQVSTTQFNMLKLITIIFETPILTFRSMTSSTCLMTAYTCVWREGEGREGEGRRREGREVSEKTPH